MAADPCAPDAVRRELLLEHRAAVGPSQLYIRGRSSVAMTSSSTAGTTTTSLAIHPATARAKGTSWRRMPTSCSPPTADRSNRYRSPAAISPESKSGKSGSSRWWSNSWIGSLRCSETAEQTDGSGAPPRSGRGPKQQDPRSSEDAHGRLPARRLHERLRDRIFVRGVENAGTGGRNCAIPLRVLPPGDRFDLVYLTRQTEDSGQLDKPIGVQPLVPARDVRRRQPVRVVGRGLLTTPTIWSAHHIAAPDMPSHGEASGWVPPRGRVTVNSTRSSPWWVRDRTTPSAWRAPR